MDDVPQNASSHSRLGRLIAKFRDGEYRDSYVRSHTKQFLARQMRAFRGDRTQTEFAEVLDVSQSVISERLENPNYGNWNLNTLFETAAKLKVAVFVRFVDFETFLKLSNNFSDNDVRPQEYNQDAMDKLATDQQDPAQYRFNPREQPSSGNPPGLSVKTTEGGVLARFPDDTETEDQPRAVEA